MEYHQDDDWLFATRVRRENAKHGWLAVITLLILICGSVALLGCDSEAAEYTARAEREAHEQKQTVMAWWYSETYQPFRASQANVTITVCQQTDSTINWYCHAGAKQ